MVELSDWLREHERDVLMNVIFKQLCSYISIPTTRYKYVSCLIQCGPVWSNNIKRDDAATQTNITTKYGDALHVQFHVHVIDSKHL